MKEPHTEGSLWASFCAGFYACADKLAVNARITDKCIGCGAIGMRRSDDRCPIGIDPSVADAATLSLCSRIAIAIFT